MKLSFIKVVNWIILAAFLSVVILQFSRPMASAFHIPTCSSGGYMTQEAAARQPKCLCKGFMITTDNNTTVDGPATEICLGIPNENFH